MKDHKARNRRFFCFYFWRRNHQSQLVKHQSSSDLHHKIIRRIKKQLLLLRASSLSHTSEPQGSFTCQVRALRYFSAWRDPNAASASRAATDSCAKA
jgi:hypothetical protein